jgi:hemoglobin-like flavoprotein
MNTEQIRLVQATFEQVRPIAATAADLFYRRLFELDPTLQTLFMGDMKKQGAMLMSAIGMAVKGLAHPDSIIPTVQALGQRHAGYGVRDEHYETVGTALLWTLEQGLGPAFTPEVRSAWAAAYRLLATTMQEAARVLAVEADLITL